jgi:lipoprotein-releasing system permease protein
MLGKVDVARGFQEPLFDRFAWSVAIRHLWFNPGQTLLTMGVVAISVTLIVFLGALIEGLQRRLVNSVTGATAHIVVRQPERIPLAAWQIPALQTNQVLYVGETIKLEQRKRKIEDWQVWLPRLQAADDNVLAVSPVVEGQGFVARGARRQAVTVTGVLPERHNQVVDIESKLVRGRFFGLNAGEVTLGYRLAEDFSVKLGDKIRLVSAEGNAGTYTVAGIFDTGFNLVDSGTVFLSLRDAQSLFGLGMAVTSLGLKLNRIFDANALADRLILQIPYEARSWMKDNQTLLSGLKAQSQSSNLILAFTTIAAGFGIASILIMSVVSKLKEIGILKAMGATRRQIVRIFAVEGTLVAILGSLAGAAQGTALSLLLAQMRTTASATGRQVEIFPMELNTRLVLVAIIVAVVVGYIASLYPAWRAARINPIEVIRGT